MLAAFDGETISYDGSGNPTSYYNGTRWTFGWEEGRRLVSATNGTTNLAFTYDSEGLRLSKTVGSTKHNYYYAGGKVLRETYGNNTLDFFYDAQGTPYAVKYNGTLYYYITNLQGDILHIVDSSGATVVSYTYSPYGKPLSTTGSLAPPWARPIPCAIVAITTTQKAAFTTSSPDTTIPLLVDSSMRMVL